MKALNLNEFTEAQQRAITSTAQNIVCIAGPGSGKTATLVKRIEHLIETGRAMPHEIACITFTNAAAKEIQERTDAALARLEQSSKLGYCGTLHGFMLSLLSAWGDLIGLPEQPLSILDEAQQKGLFEAVCKDMGVGKLSAAKMAEGLTTFNVRTLLDPRPDKLLTGVHLAAHEYYSKLMEYGVLDFDAVLEFGALLLEKLIVERQVNFTFTHLLWDEFQDTSPDDWAIFTRLPHNLDKFVVGDPDQSVFSFRGARPDYLVTLARHGNWDVIKLEDNFRSTQRICDAANKLIAHNSNRVPKLCRARPGNDAETILVATIYESDAQELADMARILTGKDPRSCAILTRTNALADRIAKGLEAYSLPIAGRVRVEKDIPPDWNEARSLINLLANPGNDFLFFWWYARREGGTRKATELKNAAAIQGLSMNVFLHDRFPPALSAKDVPAILAKEGISIQSIALVSSVVDSLSTGLVSELSLSLGEVAEVDFSEGIQVLTIHKAKGREWDYVLLPGWEQGVIPNAAKDCDLEEERRLAFVAITRARFGALISCAKERRAFWGPPATIEGLKPSQFIAEAGLLEQAGDNKE